MSLRAFTPDWSLPVVSLKPYFNPETGRWQDPVEPSVSRIFDPELSRQWHMIPFQYSEARYFVATSQPHTSRFNAIEQMLPGPVTFFLCSDEDLQATFDRVFGPPTLSADQRLETVIRHQGSVDARTLKKIKRQQVETGADLGPLLTSHNLINPWELAEALAEQYQLPLINLLHSTSPLADPTTWQAMPESFWRDHLIVPLELTSQELLIATAKPEDMSGLKRLETHFRRPVRVFVTGYRDVFHAFTQQFGTDHLIQSRTALLTSQPQNSAYRQVSTGQTAALLGIVLCLSLGLTFNAVVTGIVISLLIQIFYTGYNAFRLWMMYEAATNPPEINVSTDELAALDFKTLPIYTILVPLYREANVLPTLVDALKRLEYPPDRLDVKLLLEEDDEDTIRAAKSAALPNFIELVLVPASQPRTKPKACNYGLARARGEYVVIYDAEDIPEPDQLLKAVTVLRSSPAEVVCVQAKLSYYNTFQNVLTKWFTVEYATWFDLMLPGLFAARMPIPLGGTSNHFKTAVLQSMGAWDPFNVTEDADLGIRLYKAGYRTVIMNSTTYEEANADLVNWIRQRSRWIKGYIQTSLVHLRSPRALKKALGWRGVLGFWGLVVGTPLTVLLNPLLWALTLSWYILGPNFSGKLFPGIVYYVAIANLFIGNFTFVYVNMISLAKREEWALVIPALLSPFYWLLMSVAAWKGLWQLVSRPFYWEKTIHGLANNPISSTRGEDRRIRPESAHVKKQVTL